jgi:hypothetical protein
LVWWIVLTALVIAGTAAFVVDHVQKVRERDAVFGPGTCDEAAMVQAVQSYEKVLLFGAFVMPAFGVIVAAALTRRLRPELTLGHRGTARRLTMGILVGLVAVLAFGALLFFFGGNCLRAAVGEEGLPGDVAASVLFLGRLVPNFWLASTLSTLVASLFSFFLLGILFRTLSEGFVRLRRR